MSEIQANLKQILFLRTGNIFDNGCVGECPARRDTQSYKFFFGKFITYLLLAGGMSVVMVSLIFGSTQFMLAANDQLLLSPGEDFVCSARYYFVNKEI